MRKLHKNYLSVTILVRNHTEMHKRVIGVQWNNVKFIPKELSAQDVKFSVKEKANVLLRIKS